MQLTGMLARVAAIRPDLREFAGEIVKDEVQRLGARGRGLDVAIERSGLSKSTFYNVFRGNADVTRETLGALEGAFGWPTRFLDLVIAGDVERIKTLPNRTADPVRGIPEELRHYVLERLRDLALPRDRRSSDRRRRA